MKPFPFQSIVAAVAAGAVLAFLSGSLQANERHDPTNKNFPDLTLPGILHGEAAIGALGQNLPAVAESYGHTPDQLRGLLRSDQTLHVDEKGRLLYLDAPAPQPLTAAATTLASGAAPYPLANTFLLHSRPGAKRVIYLDFDGYVLTGTAWNSTTATINCPPWDIDGNPSSFGDSERTIIQGIWQRVSEDYLPFDVDVTTEYPGEAAMTRTDLSDDVFGVRALISPISSYFGNYGGIAYVGIFDYTSDYYKPALIFPENLANGEKYIAEAISHEVGHTLGLSHDGTTTGSAYYQGSGSGETGWAPIMGVGYYENLTQWSKGEYAYANNTEDDLTVMQSNGISYRADDHGDTIATATILPISTVLSASGIIERNTDVDVFGFTTAAGTITLAVNPAPNGANLDVLADLYTSSGVQVASSNPSGYLAASINVTVPAGTYYLLIRGTGQGDPLTGYSNYDSLGAYTVSGTVVGPTGPTPPIAVISATPVSGTAQLLVQFSGSQSYDPDGTISAYNWNFGDGGTGSGVSLSHTFTTPGNYTTTLTVTDNTGLTASATVAIVVKAPNQPPTAVINASPSTGYAPLAVSFSGTGSTDADGSILSYQWNFGDGSTASGATVSHTFAAVGTYTTTLTVTDNLGASSSTTTIISVTRDPTKVIHVTNLVVTTTNTGGWITATAVVTIGDASSAPVPQVSVSGSWSGAVTGSSTSLTDATGKVTLVSKRYKKASTVTFTVNSATKTGYYYDSSKNALSKVSAK